MRSSVHGYVLQDNIERVPESAGDRLLWLLGPFGNRLLSGDDTVNR
jgi:hypothetical protein